MADSLHGMEEEGWRGVLRELGEGRGDPGELGGYQLGPFVVGAACQVRGERARDHPGEAAEGLGELLLLVLDPVRGVVAEHVAVLAPPGNRGEVLRGADVAKVADTALEYGLLEPCGDANLERVQAGWSGFRQRDADQVAVVLQQRLGRAARTEGHGIIALEDLVQLL